MTEQFINYICNTTSEAIKEPTQWLDINNLDYTIDYSNKLQSYTSISPENRRFHSHQLTQTTQIQLYDMLVVPAKESNYLDSSSFINNKINNRFFMRSDFIQSESISINCLVQFLITHNLASPHAMRVCSPNITFPLFEQTPSLFKNLLLFETIEVLDIISKEFSYANILNIFSKHGYSLLNLEIKRAQRSNLPELKHTFDQGVIINNKRYFMDGRFGQPVLGKYTFYKDPFKDKDYLELIKNSEKEFIRFSYLLHKKGAFDIIAEVIENIYSVQSKRKKILLDKLSFDISNSTLTFNEYQQKLSGTLGNKTADSNIEYNALYPVPELKMATRNIEPEILLSIHIQSNNSKNLIQFFEKLEESASNHNSFEVCVKVDSTDVETCTTIAHEAKIRPFKIKYIKTDPPEKFPDLWKSMDELLHVSNPNSYFYLNLNDEMYFLEEGWDIRLKKYIDLFPDKIYRLRTSRFRNFRYFDFWSCGYAPETSGITTRNWLTLGGGWCPCLGPDTFQQCVSYYLSMKNLHGQNQPTRDFVVNDIRFGGEVAFAGLNQYKLKQRISESTEAWFVLCSYEIQTEASRRASKLYCNIIAKERGFTDFLLKDNKKKKRIEIRTAEGKILFKSSYKLSRLKVGFLNFIRKFNFAYYGGGGADSKYNPLKGLTQYLYFRYPAFQKFNGTLLQKIIQHLGLLSRLKNKVTK